jgi:hypothetical protein
MNPTIHRAFRSERTAEYYSRTDLTATQIEFVEVDSSEGESESPGRVMRIEILPDALPVPPVPGDELWVGDVQWFVVDVTQPITQVFQLVLHRNGC